MKVLEWILSSVELPSIGNSIEYTISKSSSWLDIGTRTCFTCQIVTIYLMLKQKPVSLDWNEVNTLRKLLFSVIQYLNVCIWYDLKAGFRILSRQFKNKKIKYKTKLKKKTHILAIIQALNQARCDFFGWSFETDDL